MVAGREPPAKDPPPSAQRMGVEAKSGPKAASARAHAGGGAGENGQHAPTSAAGAERSGPRMKANGGGSVAAPARDEECETRSPRATGMNGAPGAARKNQEGGDDSGGSSPIEFST